MARSASSGTPPKKGPAAAVSAAMASRARARRAAVGEGTDANADATPRGSRGPAASRRGVDEEGPGPSGPSGGRASPSSPTPGSWPSPRTRANVHTHAANASRLRRAFSAAHRVGGGGDGERRGNDRHSDEGKSASRRSVARRTHPEEGARSGSASPRYGAADSRTPVRGMRSRAHTEATAPRALCAPAMNRRAAALWRFRGGLDVSSRNDERGRGSIEGGDPRRPSRVAALEAHLVDGRRAALDDGDEHGEVAGGALAARAPLDHLHLRGERGAQEGDVGTRSARRGVGRGGVGAAAVAARATVARADVKDRAHEVVPRAHVPGRRRRHRGAGPKRRPLSEGNASAPALKRAAGLQ